MQDLSRPPFRTRSTKWAVELPTTSGPDQIGQRGSGVLTGDVKNPLDGAGPTIDLGETIHRRSAVRLFPMRPPMRRVRGAPS